MITLKGPIKCKSKYCGEINADATITLNTVIDSTHVYTSCNVSMECLETTNASSIVIGDCRGDKNVWIIDFKKIKIEGEFNIDNMIMERDLLSEPLYKSIKIDMSCESCVVYGQE